MTQTDFDPFALPLSGITLIEASAGTGKTYTIAGLYLRLVIEQALPVNAILVMTFTNAAVAELNDRLRQRLLLARRALQLGAGDDEFGRQLLDHLERIGLSPTVADNRLENAIRGFDEAAVHTIHGFCHRVLGDHAFASGLPFDLEYEGDDEALLQQVVQDFWRREFHRTSRLRAAAVAQRQLSPDALANSIRSHLNQTYLQRIGDQPPDDLESMEQRYEQAWRHSRDIWHRHGGDFGNWLQSQNILDGRKYKRRSFAHWLQSLDALFEQAPISIDLPKHLERLTPAAIAAANKSDGVFHHPVLDSHAALLSAHSALAAALTRYFVNMKSRLLSYCNSELRQRKRAARVQSHDDLLNDLAAALANGAAGAKLTAALRSRYPAVLVDEFQDTDPVQYDILKQVYGGNGLPVLLVGDPKQAIYAFRGADIYSYLQAREDAGHHESLTRNWRSDADLVDAVNVLFSGHRLPFLLERISFTKVAPAARTEPKLTIAEVTAPPLRFWFLDSEDDKPLTKALATERAAAATADEIAHLLSAATDGHALLGNRPLAGGDITVLVRKHEQGRVVRQALAARGVACIKLDQDSVYHTGEAEEIERILLAAAGPWNEQRVRSALASVLLGKSAAEIAAFADDEQQWQREHDRFFDYNQRWQSQGFAVFWRALMDEYDIAARLLSLPDGERRLTNVLHVSELLQAASRRERRSPGAIVQWLSAQRQARQIGNDEYQLRLESDENLVNIVTVHRSKGLEYGIVFCPFLWDAMLDAEKIDLLRFHDTTKRHSATLDFGSEAIDTHRALAVREQMAESLRLLYVALTRAKHRCYVTWGRIKDAGRSPLAWLLLGSEVATETAPEHAIVDLYQSLSGARLLARLEQLAAAAPKAIAVCPLAPASRYRIQPAPGWSPVVRQWRRSIAEPWRVTSFTGLAAQQAAELPDYDDQQDTATVNWVEDIDGSSGIPAIIEDTRGIAHFPAGAHAGACLHDIFEHWDFACDDSSALRRLTEATLARHGFDTRWTETVAECVTRVLATPLGATATPLNAVEAASCAKEMEFYFPLATIDGGGLRRVLQSEHRWPIRIQRRLASLEFGRIHGFLKGYIDLVFEVDGVFHIVDYKSNRLGMTQADYHPDRLADTIAADDYYLQYLLYVVAVHRYLQTRVPGYDYEHNFGSVYYLFIRGMAPQSPELGVYKDRPPRRLLESLDRYIGGR